MLFALQDTTSVSLSAMLETRDHSLKQDESDFVYSNLERITAFARKSETSTQQHGLSLVVDTSDTVGSFSDDTLAWGSFHRDKLTGFDVLSIRTSERHTDTEQAFAAGYIEGEIRPESLSSLRALLPLDNTGAITRDRIWAFYSSYFVHNGGKFYSKIHEWVDQHNAFLLSQVKGNTDKDEDGYWHTVGLVLVQLDGMLAG